jgi:hypothetical protein
MSNPLAPPLAQPLRVALIWNGALQAEHLLRTARPVVLGEGKDALFLLPDGALADEKVTLLEPTAQGFSVQPARGMGGYVWQAGRARNVRDLREPMPLATGDYGLVTFGDASVFFQQVRPVQGPPPKKAYRDSALGACIGLSVFVHVAMILFLFLVAAEEYTPDGGGELDSELVRKFLITPPPEELKQLMAKKPSGNMDDPGMRDRDEPGGKRADKQEGKVGRKDATRERTEVAGKPLDAIAQQVRGMGLLGVLAGGGKTSVSDALQTPSLENLLGGLGAAQTIVGRGSGGMGLRGGGPGGGGQGNGVMFGAGKLGTGVGGGKGLGAGSQGLGIRGPKEAQLALGGEGAKVSGFLSREQINRVVQANRAAIKYCFETALQRAPKLEGAINVYWRIDRKGLVASTRVNKSTLGDSKVEGCILRQIARWKFPEPDGGEVDVVYPFIFRAP